MAALRLRPDWVMVAFESGGVFTIYGSVKLSEAEIRQFGSQAQDIARALPGGAASVSSPSDQRQQFALTAKMEHVAAGFGASYREALMNLLLAWDPDVRPTDAPITEGDLRALGPG